MSITASSVGVFVALLTFAGALLIANSLGPDASMPGKVFGSLLLGAAAGIGLSAVIISVRDATLRKPPPETRPPGKVEI